MSLIINIPRDFTKSPGGRFKKEGDFSGEEFREKILLPKVQETLNNNLWLTVEVDGGFDYGSSFLEESFGGLARKTKEKRLLKILTIISDEEPELIDDIMKYIKDGLENGE